MVFPRAVFRIRIRRIGKFLGLADPDSFLRGTDPDPAIIIHHAKILRKTLVFSTLLCLLYDFLSLKNDVNVGYLQKVP
jgi:hypothetical protein